MPVFRRSKKRAVAVNTNRSRWNRQFQQTSDNLGQSVEELGYAIGQAAARSSLRKKAEKQKEAKFQECARAATSKK